MTIDPRNYDLGELRDMGRREDGPDYPDFDDPGASLGIGRRSHTGRNTAEETRRDDRYRTLLVLQRAAGDNVTKPYLDDVPPSNAAEAAVFEWLEFLVDRAGRRGAMEALRYYRNVEWVTEDAMYELEEYLFGLSDAENDHYAELTAYDHRESLVYLAELNALA